MNQIPFTISYSPAIFQPTVGMLLKDILNVVVYIYGIVVFCKIIEEYNEGVASFKAKLDAIERTEASTNVSKLLTSM